jgi:hypothetical protein
MLFSWAYIQKYLSTLIKKLNDRSFLKCQSNINFTQYF